jgi:hypothetical protein
MIREQFPITRSPQKTLAGLFFALVVVGVARDQPVASPKSFVTGGDPNPPLCENINDTLGISIIIFEKLAHTRKISYEIRQEDH